MLRQRHMTALPSLWGQGKANKHFTDNPGTYYYTSGWLERAGSKVERKVQDGRGMGAKYEEYVKKYGEDNAKYLMEFENSWIDNYSCAAYIDLEFVRFLGYKKEAEKIAEQRGWRYEELPGDVRLIEKLIDGEWDENEFLIAQPGEEIVPSYDNHVLKCKAVHNDS